MQPAFRRSCRERAQDAPSEAELGSVTSPTCFLSPATRAERREACVTAWAAALSPEGGRWLPTAQAVGIARLHSSPGTGRQKSPGCDFSSVPGLNLRVPATRKNPTPARIRRIPPISRAVPTQPLTRGNNTPGDAPREGDEIWPCTNTASLAHFRDRGHPRRPPVASREGAQFTVLRKIPHPDPASISATLSEDAQTECTHALNILIILKSRSQKRPGVPVLSKTVKPNPSPPPPPAIRYTPPSVSRARARP